MNYLDILPDIPRYLTAIAEWSAVFVYCCILIKKTEVSLIVKAISLLIGQLILQLIAGQFPSELWVFGMFINIGWMFLSIFFLSNVSSRIQLFILTKAFVLSELLASVGWLIYCVTIYQTPMDRFSTQGILNLIIYITIIVSIFFIEKNNDLSFVYTTLTKKDILVAGLMGVITFIISNIGFLLSSTPYNLGNSLAIFSLRMVVNVSGLSLLYIQQYIKLDNYRQQELNNINRLFNSQYQQYKAYAESTEYINRKAHDLKHQINIIISEPNVMKRENYLSNMRESINNLDIKIETGHGVLDTILTQKNQYCLENNINFISMVNGKLLANMDVMDLSSLIGNALDNAIEYVEKLQDEEKRLITLKLTNKGKIVILKVDNYFVEEIDNLDELPRTSKEDKENHGYGLKSIQYIAEKYEGNMSVNIKDSWFTLSIVLPIL